MPFPGILRHGLGVFVAGSDHCHVTLASVKSLFSSVWTHYLPKPRNKGKIQVEDILQPFDGRGGFVGQDLDEVWPCLVAGRFQGVIVELFNTVLDLVVDLRSCQGAIDTGSGLGGVASKEA